MVLGRFGRPQGLKGFIRVISFTQPEANILDYLPWHIQAKKTWLPIQVERSQIQDRTILVKIYGYDEREVVAELTNSHIGILAENLPKLPDDEFYWHELLGMLVVNKQSIELGKIVQIMPTGTHEVLVIEGEKHHLIPYVPELYIEKVDTVQRQIIVDWDEND